MHRSRLPIASLALVALLAGCAAGTPEPRPTDPSAIATPEPTLALAPTPLIVLDCEDALSQEDVDTLMGGAMTAHGDEYRDGSATLGIPYEYSIASLQGTTCTWTNDASRYEPNGNPGVDFDRLQLLILPNGEDEWASYHAVYGTTEDYPADCWGSDRIYCSWSGLLDDTWVEVSSEGMTSRGSATADRDAFEAVIDKLSGQLASAATGPAWAPSGRNLPTGCPGVLTVEAISVTTGVAADTVRTYSGPIGGTSLVFEAEKSFSSDPCRWATVGNGGEYGNEVSVLRGGAWAFEEARTLDSDVANAAAISLDGLSDDDSAWLRAGDMVSIDLVLGGNWINLWIITDSADRTADTATLTALAQAIVDGLQ